MLKKGAWLQCGDIQGNRLLYKERYEKLRLPKSISVKHKTIETPFKVNII